MREERSANQRARRQVRADLKINLHLGAKLAPNCHDNPLLQEFSDRLATDPFWAFIVGRRLVIRDAH